LEAKHIKIKILFTIPNFDSAGSGKALLNVAKNLDTSKFEPHICCSHSKGDYYKTVQDSGIPIHIKQTTHPMIPRMKGIKISFKLAKFFKTLKIDIIHSYHYGDDYSEAVAARIAGIPWIYTKKNMNWGGKSKNSWFLRTLLSKHILVQNTDMIKEFFKKSKKISLVARGVNTKEFFPSKPNEKLLDKYKIKKNDNVIICVANLHPIKGVETLIDAFSGISRNFHPIHLFIVGFDKNIYADSLKVRLKKNRSLQNVYFTGKVNNVKDFLSISDLFILPTLKTGEGSPVALLEALASGIKVIGSEVCGIKDILKFFPENMFESGNVNQLKKRIEKQLILKDNDKMEKILNYTIKNYDIKIEAKKHENIYSKILGSDR